MEKKISKKAFVATLERQMNEEQCATYLKEYAKNYSAVYRQHWQTLSGFVGNVSRTISGTSENAREKALTQHPDWRPLGEYHFWTRGWRDMVEVHGYIQSWEDLYKVSDTNNLTIYLYKHPVQ